MFYRGLDKPNADRADYPGSGAEGLLRSCCGLNNPAAAWNLIDSQTRPIDGRYFQDRVGRMR